MKQARRLLRLLLPALALALAPSIHAGEATTQPAAAKLESPHVFPALGASFEPKVRADWNRFHDNAGLFAILSDLNKAFPDLTKLYSLGKSVDGRDLWCLEVTARKAGNPDRKPGMYIDGNIHGNEVQGGEVVAYTAWYLCHQHGRLARVTELLDRAVFYLVPTNNPDGRDYWLHNPNTASSSRSGLRPHDDDRDGLIDEDGPDDLNGDGVITYMRIRDPNGRLKRHPDFPNYLMVPARDDERGEFTILGLEGIDNDGDGRVNEDGPGGYDANRNWPWDWQPGYIQNGSLEYPASLPETRAIVEFVLAHPNIGAMQSYHNSGGMILRSPGRAGGVIRPQDDQVLSYIASIGEKVLPFYRSMVIYRDLYTVWGGEIDWFYGGRGILSFTNELWTPANLYRDATRTSDAQDIEFLKYALLEDGVVEWKEYDHPTYGRIEIGGTRKEWGRTPPSFLLEEECHRNMSFTLYHASTLPQLRIAEVKAERLANNLHKVWVTIENQRLMPTRSAQDVANHITRQDVVTLTGPKVQVLSSGFVRDRFFREVVAVERRPERIEIESVSGMQAVRVQFIIGGEGAYTITVDSVKGGLVTFSQTLP
jgi:hypothetical protein